MSFSVHRVHHRMKKILLRACGTETAYGITLRIVGPASRFRNNWRMMNIPEVYTSCIWDNNDRCKRLTDAVLSTAVTKGIEYLSNEWFRRRGCRAEETKCSAGAGDANEDTEGSTGAKGVNEDTECSTGAVLGIEVREVPQAGWICIYVRRVPQAR